MCIGKGAVTVVNSSDGYICGGYTDVAWCGGADWKSSTESFLFSLKDHAGVGPAKMPIQDRPGGLRSSSQFMFMAQLLEMIVMFMLPLTQMRILDRFAVLAIRINFQAIPMITTS